MIDYLKDRNWLKEDFRVLDIGCGPGSYALEMAKYTKEVVGIDLSDKMIEFGKENMKKFGQSNVSLETMDWEELNVEEKGWAKAFDLAFASMSPALNTEESIDKMNLVSRKYCYASGFIDRKEPLADELHQEIFGTPREKQSHNRMYRAFYTLVDKGYHPEMKHLAMHQVKDWTLEQAWIFYKGIMKLDDDHKPLFMEYVQKRRDRGVKEYFDATVGIMTWSVD
ncbi:MAG TPA: hypothetical protein DHN33_11695 [Eubacteriaceae bacterium]|nr:hypothetical protein [Eubacteriaceae bacterium]